VSVTVYLRRDNLPDEAVLLVHLGSGGEKFVLDAALRNYPAYRSLDPEGWGRFTVSVFAAASMGDRERILSTFDRRQYGTATVGDVRAHFPLLATSDDDLLQPAHVRALQALHYDVELPALLDRRLQSTVPLADPALAGACTEHLVPHIATLLALFLPRQRYHRDEGVS
jgi:hypothetical protein